MSQELLVPNLSVNDDELQIFFVVEDGACVSAGEHICEFESSKSTAVYSSESDGYIKFLVGDGDTVKVGKPFAVISKEILSSSDLQLERRDLNQSNEYAEFNLTKNALEYVKSLKIDLALLPKDKLLKKEDIDLILQKSNGSILENLTISEDSLVIIGAGSLTLLMIDAVKQTNYKLLGLLDNKVSVGSAFFDTKVIGDDSHENLIKLKSLGLKNIFVGFGATMNHSVRLEKFNLLKTMGFNFPNIIHNTAFVHSTAKLGNGNFISTMVSIGPNSIVGDNCFILDGSLISHDCFLGDNSYISPGATMAGYVKLGKNVLIGMNSTVFYKLEIGDDSKIYNGVNVFQNIPNASTIKSN
jgi:sugar O-acyltransferase (sialic acid O-acetyltransferase NeuD family)